ncbi:MAG: TlpA family protein disulfide reductase [Planctomycetes bacterium]|nr:TlpA family protein disulfide reductase [Planctomycetota bacterium]
MRFLALLCVLLLPSLASAQRTLGQLQSDFARRSQQLDQKQPTREQRLELLAQQIGELETFVRSEAKGDDRWNGQLMLADLQLARGDRKAAAQALQQVDAAAAGGLLLTSAAAMAQHLNLKDLRERFVAAAVTKDAPLTDRLAMARLLSTVLREVERGEAMFAAALAAAGDDEQRALVRWHRADGLRDREDLSDNAGFEELEKLAKELPKTYWGSVAADRLRATQLKPGDAAIPFAATARNGAKVSLEALRGKSVALVFWSAADRDLPGLLALLQKAQQQRGANLAVVGICLDRDPAAIDAAIRANQIEFPVVGDGKGIETDVALRWFVEGPTVHVLDGSGKVRALGLHAGTQDARQQLGEALGRD